VPLPRRLDVNVQAEQAKSAEAPFANVDGGSEATTACLIIASPVSDVKSGSRPLAHRLA